MLTSDLQKLSVTGLVTLYELDATKLGAGIMRWHGHVSFEDFKQIIMWAGRTDRQVGNKQELVGTASIPDENNTGVKRDLIWQGNVYEPLPIKSDGLEVRGDGKASMPTLNISANSEDAHGFMQIGFIRALCLQYHDLAGARLTVTNTLAQYLDATNFSDGNPQADPNEYRKQVWFVEQKTGENALSVTFELSNPVDFEGSRIPSREITSYCHWALHGLYRGQECKYMGTSMFTEDGTPTDRADLDRCGGRLSDCRIRNNEQNFGGFPSSSLIKG